MRLSHVPALAALLVTGSCALDFARFEGSVGGSTDGSTHGGPDGSVDGSGPLDASGSGEAMAEASASEASASSSGGGGADSGAGSDAADARAGDGSIPVDAAPDASDITSGLVAYYKFDESTGSTASDSSGNGNTATLSGGATFSAGIQGNALTLSGTMQYASLPAAVVGGFTAYSVATWVNPSAVPSFSRIFDFGSGTTSYMFLTPNSGTALRFAITTGGAGREQQLNATPLATGSWQHVVLTLGANSTGTLYVNGAVVARSTTMSLDPSSLGTTTQRWIGHSEFSADPYFSGQLDNFRVYSRVLGAADVAALYAGHL